MQIHIDNRTDIPINAAMLNTIASTLTSRDIEVIFTDNAAISELNARHRGKNKPTDVLSFPLEGDLPYVPLGSIVISVEYAQEKARAFAHTLDDEIALLFIHGLLHLLGYDHETDNGEMRKKEREIIEAFELPQSLIVRTEGE
jgi:probable rRNA maturation factor